MLKWPWMQYVSWLQVELFTFANHVISSLFASMNCELPRVYSVSGRSLRCWKFLQQLCSLWFCELVMLVTSIVLSLLP